jgi:hypothetical protein
MVKTLHDLVIRLVWVIETTELQSSDFKIIFSDITTFIKNDLIASCSNFTIESTMYTLQVWSQAEQTCIELTNMATMATTMIPFHFPVNSAGILTILYYLQKLDWVSLLQSTNIEKKLQEVLNPLAGEKKAGLGGLIDPVDQSVLHRLASTGSDAESLSIQGRLQRFLGNQIIRTDDDKTRYLDHEGMFSLFLSSCEETVLSKRRESLTSQVGVENTILDIEALDSTARKQVENALVALTLKNLPDNLSFTELAKVIEYKNTAITYLMEITLFAFLGYSSFPIHYVMDYTYFLSLINGGEINLERLKELVNKALQQFLEKSSTEQGLLSSEELPEQPGLERGESSSLLRGRPTSMDPSVDTHHFRDREQYPFSPQNTEENEDFTPATDTIQLTEHLEKFYFKKK